jgi:hypothetical protein
MSIIGWPAPAVLPDRVVWFRATIALLLFIMVLPEELFDSVVLFKVVDPEYAPKAPPPDLE